MIIHNIIHEKTTKNNIYLKTNGTTIVKISVSFLKPFKIDIIKYFTFNLKFFTLSLNKKKT